MQNILEESMGEVIEFPVELTRPPAGIAYDLDTVAVVSEVLYQIMEDRDYEIDQKLKDDIKVLTNLAYAAVRRQAEEEDEQHHPYIHINFKKILVIMFTHKIDGLHENDFIMASKCDDIKK